MKEKKDRNLANRELDLYHEYFADSIIDPNLYRAKNRYIDQDNSESVSKTSSKEESKFMRSLKNRSDIPTELWMG